MSRPSRQGRRHPAPAGAGAVRARRPVVLPRRGAALRVRHRGARLRDALGQAARPRGRGRGPCGERRAQRVLRGTGAGRSVSAASPTASRAPCDSTRSSRPAPRCWASSRRSLWRAPRRSSSRSTTRSARWPGPALRARRPAGFLMGGTLPALLRALARATPPSRGRPACSTARTPSAPSSDARDAVSARAGARHRGPGLFRGRSRPRRRRGALALDRRVGAPRRPSPSARHASRPPTPGSRSRSTPSPAGSRSATRSSGPSCSCRS